jgi:hypothetical protein
MSACLILKPKLIKTRSTGKVLSALELSGCKVKDMFALSLTSEDLYRFFELQLKYPSAQELSSFKGGISLIFELDPWINWTPLSYTYYSPSEEAGLKDCRYWFGGGL